MKKWIGVLVLALALLGGVGVDQIRAESSVTITQGAESVARTPKTVKLVYKMNGGKKGSKTQASFKSTGSVVTLTQPKRTGYTLDHWELTDGTAFAPAEGQTKTEISIDYLYEEKISLLTSGKLTVTAIWKPNTYNIVYHNGSKDLVLDSSGTLIDATGKTVSDNTYGESFALETGWWVSNGKAFAGWAKKSGGSVAYKPGKSVKNLTAKDGATVHLYAVWKKSKTANYSLTAEATSGGIILTAKFPSEFSELSLYPIIENRETLEIERVLSDEPVTGADGVFETFLPADGEDGARPIVSSLSYAVRIEEKDGTVSYQPLLSPTYVAHPENLAVTALYEPGATKKGMQEYYAFYDGTNFSDSSNFHNKLNCDHVFLNIQISEILLAVEEDEETARAVYAAWAPVSEDIALMEYNGRYFVFQNYYQNMLQAYNDNNVSVTVQILCDNGDRAWHMRHSKVKDDTAHRYYSWENVDTLNRERIEATFLYLAEAFGGVDGHPYVSNWILGNEVNSYKAWQYSGKMTSDEFYRSYSETFHILYNAVRSVNSEALVYTCVDHCWKVAVAGYSAKSFLDKFATYEKKLDDTVNWNIAFHPYANPLTSTNVNSGSAKVVTMGNLSVVTNYANGKGAKVLLSELGYTYKNTKGNVQAEAQKNAIVKSYEIAAKNPTVVAMHLRSYNDEEAEVAQKLWFGLADEDGTLRPAGEAYRDLR